MHISKVMLSDASRKYESNPLKVKNVKVKEINIKIQTK